ncbi:hypothetical protein GE09DRAFT_1161267, partial [Coniochaeta sp. 2T2.1]
MDPPKAPNDNVLNDNAPNDNVPNSNTPRNETLPPEVPYDDATDTMFFAVLFALDTVDHHRWICADHKKFILRFILYGRERPTSISLRHTARTLGLLDDKITPGQSRVEKIERFRPPDTEEPGVLSVETTRFPVLRNVLTVAQARFWNKPSDWEVMVGKLKDCVQPIEHHYSDLFRGKVALARNILWFAVDGQYALEDLCGPRSILEFLYDVKGVLDCYFHHVYIATDSLFPMESACKCLLNQVLRPHARDSDNQICTTTQYVSAAFRSRIYQVVVRLALDPGEAALIHPRIRDILLKPGRAVIDSWEGNVIDRLAEVWDRPEVQRDLEDLKRKWLEEEGARIKHVQESWLAASADAQMQSKKVPDRQPDALSQPSYAIDILGSLVKALELPETSEPERDTVHAEWLIRVLDALTGVERFTTSTETAEPAGANHEQDASENHPHTGGEVKIPTTQSARNEQTLAEAEHRAKEDYNWKQTQREWGTTLQAARQNYWVHDKHVQYWAERRKCWPEEDRVVADRVKEETKVRAVEDERRRQEDQRREEEDRRRYQELARRKEEIDRQEAEKQAYHHHVVLTEALIKHAQEVIQRRSAEVKRRLIPMEPTAEQPTEKRANPAVNKEQASMETSKEIGTRLQCPFCGIWGHAKLGADGCLGKRPVCTFCRKFGHVEDNCVKRKNKLCTICGVRGHTEEECRKDYLEVRKVREENALK